MMTEISNSSIEKSIRALNFDNIELSSKLIERNIEPSVQNPSNNKNSNRSSIIKDLRSNKSNSSEINKKLKEHFKKINCFSRAFGKENSNIDSNSNKKTKTWQEKLRKFGNTKIYTFENEEEFFSWPSNLTDINEEEQSWQKSFKSKIHSSVLDRNCGSILLCKDKGKEIIDSSMFNEENNNETGINFLNMQSKSIKKNKQEALDKFFSSPVLLKKKPCDTIENNNLRSSEKDYENLLYLIEKNLEEGKNVDALGVKKKHTKTEETHSRFKLIQAACFNKQLKTTKIKDAMEGRPNNLFNEIRSLGYNNVWSLEQYCPFYIFKNNKNLSFRKINNLNNIYGGEIKYIDQSLLKEYKVILHKALDNENIVFKSLNQLNGFHLPQYITHLLHLIPINNYWSKDACVKGKAYLYKLELEKYEVRFIRYENDHYQRKSVPVFFFRNGYDFYPWTILNNYKFK